MPDESCRNCGNLLETVSLCKICRRSNRKICLSCLTPTLEQIHVSCINTFRANLEKLGKHCLGEGKSVHVLSPYSSEGIKIPSSPPLVQNYSSNYP